jgi:predicted transposase/invertase (TIGR01784 family)
MAKLPMNDELLPPSDDHVFKTLLTHPDAKPALIDLLSAVIGRDVKDAQIRNNELPATDIEEKQERLDVNCVVDDGSQVDVEMHGSHIQEIGGRHDSFLNKSIYYLTDLHSSQKSKGLKYMDLARTYQVTFCTYTVFPRRKDYVTVSGLRTPDGELISDQINMVVVELSKLGDVLKKPVSEMTSLEMWSVFLGYASEPEHRKLVNEMIERKEVLGMAGAVLTSISKDEHERAKFRSRRMAETDRISNLLTAREDGILIGEERGREEGITLGQLDMVRKMKAATLPIEQIAQISGLSIAEIEQL